MGGQTRRTWKLPGHCEGAAGERGRLLEAVFRLIGRNIFKIR